MKPLFQSPMLWYMLAMLLPLVLTVVMAPVIRSWCLHHGVVDRNDGRRKLHQGLIPRTGGIALFAAYVFTVGCNISFMVIKPHTLHLIQGLLIACTIIFLVGLLDDLKGLNPWVKLAGQIAAALVAYSAGARLQGVNGFHFTEWYISIPLTVFWLVFCTNAFNLIDGMDGAAAGVGLFSAITIAIAGLMHGNKDLVLAIIPLIGALIGFLRYNFPPASIFLGDSGSYFIGFILGCCGLIWAGKAVAIVALTAPVLAMGIPLLDTVIAVVRRLLRGEKIFSGDRGHIHHRLLARGFTVRQAALILYGISGLGAVASLLMATGDERYVSGALLLVAALAIFVNWMIQIEEFYGVRKILVRGRFREEVRAEIHLLHLRERLAKTQTPDAWWKACQEGLKEFGVASASLQASGRFSQAVFGDADGTLLISLPLSADASLTVRISKQSAAEFSVLNEVIEALCQSWARLTLNEPAQALLPLPLHTASAGMIPGRASAAD